MPVSPEQRKILLERLEMARKAKAEKSEMPKPEKKKKEPAVAAQTDVPPSEPATLPQLSPAPTPTPPALKIPAPEDPPKPKKNQKNKYMKVVFYSEPGKKKVENLLKSLDDDASDSAPVRAPKAKKPIQTARKSPSVKKPNEDDSLDELAKLYFS